MKLVWKLLRHHISVPQLAGFFFANLFGMFIVLLAYQFYCDTLPVFEGEDSFMKADYVIVNKKIGAATTISGRDNTFRQDEIAELGQQPFVKTVGAFTAAEYKVEVAMGIDGTSVLNSEFFFESIPDSFIDVPLRHWQYRQGDVQVPIILPRSYITMYNFGFARSRSLPKISEGILSLIDVRLSIRGNGRQASFKGKVIGFTSKLSTILVPQTFMTWSNRYFAPDAASRPNRLILDVTDPADPKLSTYFDDHNLEAEDRDLSTEKTVYFLRLVVTIVMIVGLFISVLSFYILMLSIYLLVQKNADKLQNLLLIGYSPSAVARPYQLLTILLNVGVLVMALVLLFVVRRYYTDLIQTLLPDVSRGSMLPAVGIGALLFFAVTVVNAVVIRRKITQIWFTGE